MRFQRAGDPALTTAAGLPSPLLGLARLSSAACERSDLKHEMPLSCFKFIFLALVPRGWEVRVGAGLWGLSEPSQRRQAARNAAVIAEPGLRAVPCPLCGHGAVAVCG